MSAKINAEKNIRESFARALQESLLRRYNKIPSSSFVAREFNLRSQHPTPISVETARRWLKGVSIPEFDRLIVLRKWLTLDLNLLCIGDDGRGAAPFGGNSVNVLTSDREKFVKLVRSIGSNIDYLLEEIDRVNS